MFKKILLFFILLHSVIKLFVKKSLIGEQECSVVQKGILLV